VQELGGEVLYRDTRYSQTLTYSDRSWTSDQVIHFGMGEGDFFFADSPIQSLSSTLALFDAVYTHLISYFGHAARPSAHFKVDPHASDAVLTKTAEYIRDFFAGPANAGKVLITSAEWQQMSDAPDNARVIELAKQSREEICGVYGVAPPLVGILDRAIMSNVRELREHTTRDTVGPYVEGFDGAFNAQLYANHPLYRRFWRETETSAHLKADLEGSAATYPNQLRIMTVNELRQTKNLPRLDDAAADLPWYPNGPSDSSGAEGAESETPTASALTPARRRKNPDQLSLPDIEE
jgi:phage portal protein BeeE